MTENKLKWACPNCSFQKNKSDISLDNMVVCIWCGAAYDADYFKEKKLEIEERRRIRNEK
jgi:rubredoxin